MTGLFDAILSKSPEELHQIGQNLIGMMKEKMQSTPIGDFLNHQQQGPGDAPIPVGPFNIKPFTVGEDVAQNSQGGPGRDSLSMVPGDPNGYALMDGQDHNPLDFLLTMKAGNPLFSLYSSPVYAGTNNPKVQQETVNYGVSVGPWRQNLGQYTRDFAPHQIPGQNYQAPQWTPPIPSGQPTSVPAPPGQTNPLQYAPP